MPLTVSEGLLGPLIAFAVIGLLAVLLRWIFGRGSSVPHPVRLPARSEDYGLLCTVAITADEQAAIAVAVRLAGAGIRATLATGSDGGVRVLVFEDQIEAARRLVG
jgi:hypothetical protein